MITSVEEFVRLRTSSDPEDYDRASRDEAPSDVWLAVISDHPDMRFWVAQNKTVPLSVLELLATDEDPKVRAMVARKRKLAPQVLMRLATDTDDAVRAAVARHPKAPPAVLRMLANDRWNEISEIAKRRLEALG